MAAADCVVKQESEKNYDLWTKQELIARLHEFEAPSSRGASQSFKKERARKRPFCWENVSKRHILLKFLYFGWDYNGYASQVCTTETVEEHLMSALTRCCLIEKRETSNYHRCGRTDAGVTAFSQVISIDVRSKLKEPDETNTGEELEYCKMLNRLLPLDIRCYAWCHVGSEVSARFDCTARAYNYFFPRGSLDIHAMQGAARHLEGTHDFRNLCKMDVGNGVVEFIRTIDHVEIVSVGNDEPPEIQMMKLVVQSRGFLWHQIRCIMAVLLLVGEGNEEPSIVAELLDVNRVPCKPQYHMATAYPLSLAEAEYGGLNLRWNTSPEEIEYLSGQLQGVWTEYAVKEKMVRDALNRVAQLSPQSSAWQRQTHLYTGVVAKVHVPLLKRPTCNSLEDRVESVQRKKMRLANEIQQSST